MIIRQLKQAQFEALRNALAQKALVQPFDASYTVHMTVGAVEYALKLQPESRCRMAVLQACKIGRGGSAPDFELITKGNILSSLLEILVYQGVG